MTLLDTDKTLRSPAVGYDPNETVNTVFQLPTYCGGADGHGTGVTTL